MRLAKASAVSDKRSLFLFTCGIHFLQCLTWLQSCVWGDGAVAQGCAAQGSLLLGGRGTAGSVGSAPGHRSASTSYASSSAHCQFANRMAF